MKTLDDIKAKCEIFPKENGSSKEHWVWIGAKNKKGDCPVCAAPDYTKDATGKTQTTQNVRRAIRHITKKRGIPKGLMGVRVCTVESCVSPDCTSWMTRKVYGKFLQRDGRHCGLVKKRLAAQKRWAGKRKVTPEMAAAFLSDTRPSAKVGADWGVDKTTVQWHRNGKAVGPGISIFSGLLR